MCEVTRSHPPRLVCTWESVLQLYQSCETQGASGLRNETVGCVYPSSSPRLSQAWPRPTTEAPRWEAKV
jgi:hypothetical protein